MRRIICICAFVSIAFASFADPITITVFPRKVFMFEGIKKSDIASVDGPDMSSTPPYFEGSRGIVFILSNGTINRYDFSFNKYYLSTAETGILTASAQHFSNDILTVVAFTSGPRAMRYSDDFRLQAGSSAVRIEPICLLENLVLYRNTSTQGISYTSFLFNKDGTVNTLNNARTLEYTKNNLKYCTIMGGYIYYKGNKLFQAVDQFDDDGNQYNSRIVQIDNYNKYSIVSNLDENYLPALFDNEGNFWQISYSSDNKQNVTLYYSGRDWGYHQPPKRAMCTSENLRIRLRATTDAFILGKLTNDQFITIIKTGENETIDGKNAPWYRIKTADGIIGWAWGGFIKVTE
jgi:hypothetical protein